MPLKGWPNHKSYTGSSPVRTTRETGTCGLNGTKVPKMLFSSNMITELVD